MDLTTFDHPEQVGQEFLAIDVASLYQAFEQVKDGRGKKGKMNGSRKIGLVSHKSL